MDSFAGSANPRVASRRVAPGNAQPLKPKIPHHLAPGEALEMRVTSLLMVVNTWSCIDYQRVSARRITMYDIERHLGMYKWQLRAYALTHDRENCLFTRNREWTCDLQVFVKVNQNPRGSWYVEWRFSCISLTFMRIFYWDNTKAKVNELPKEVYAQDRTKMQPVKRESCWRFLNDSLSGICTLRSYLNRMYKWTNTINFVLVYNKH